jgi:hypothetical protein
MTIQENNKNFQIQLIKQAEKSRMKYLTLSSRNMTPYEEKIALEHITRAYHFENIAKNML